ncbi:hypothetical protein SAMN04487895_1066 [Paenibacillus sophorae]|uniref:Uncharacterized protein n=1 Tax=Paenibacillus sophorae TaxID=1333845 RepID=A0A1H8N1L0_9BACL|nr:hypothetical protein [Paenibacillus sophorae]QWU14827.1 hypothetical protein KP014_23340 [Paenibacillus sophorae]SEO23515.1 hypothetical protein SAMN04487895_1066 [Paenibacillus sophorae]
MANKKSIQSIPQEEELSAEDYAIIAAALSALGDFFFFLSLVKAKESTQAETNKKTK